MGCTEAAHQPGTQGIAMAVLGSAEVNADRVITPAYQSQQWLIKKIRIYTELTSRWWSFNYSASTIECLLHAMHSSRYWGYNNEQNL